MASVIDFSKFDTGKKKELADELVNALKTDGFFYLKNFGIAAERVNKLFIEAKEFFESPLEQKMLLFQSDKSCQRTSYDPPGLEALANGFSEQKESLDFILNDIPEKAHDSRELKPVLDELSEMYRLKCDLAKKILRCLAIGLGVEDEFFFVNCHKHFGNYEKSPALSRVIYYPEFTGELSGQTVRLAPHTDYGALTLHFQDDVGGFECNAWGEYKDAKPIPDTCLVFVGALMEVWTGGELRAAYHRVRSTDPEQLRKKRQAAMFFCHPDYDTVVTPLKPVPGVQSVLADEYLRTRYQKAFNAKKAKQIAHE